MYAVHGYPYPAGYTALPGGFFLPPMQGQEHPSQGLPPLEESYVENILRMNLGKVATVYMTFENNDQWNAKVFRGRVEAAARDHLILSDPETGKRYLLLMVNLDYIVFDEPLNYVPPPAPGMPIRRPFRP